jgi:GT2 family glycosyltransferase
MKKGIGMTGQAPAVGIALLNWNQYDDTALCLSSLRESEFRPTVILVHDNGSTDGSAERLKADFPEIQLVMGGRNHGFSDGNNRAAKILLDAGMDYIWILNNDTKVEPGCLGALVRTLEGEPSLGAASAKIWFMDAGKPICYAGATFNRWTFNACFRGLRRKDVGQFDTAGDTEIFSGCCMLVRADALRKIGLFNRAFFAYAEDIDWSLRAMEAGIRQRYEPRAALWHKMFGASRKEGGSIIPKSSPRVEFLLARNRFVLVRLHTEPRTFRRWFALGYHIFIRRLPRAAGLLLKKDRRAAGRAIFAGLWAGLWLRPDPADCRL